MKNGIVIRPLNLVYWYIPKNACTSFKRYFADFLELHYDKEDNATVHTAPFELITPDEAENFQGFHHFAVIRHPLDRLYSLYKNKIMPDMRTDALYKNGHERNVFSRYGSKFYGGMPFSKFVDEIASIPLDCADPHFLPQHYLLSNAHGEIVATHVLKLSALEKELKSFALVCGHEIKLGKFNASVYNENDLKEMQSCSQAVRQHFYTTYRIFGYE